MQSILFHIGKITATILLYPISQIKAAFLHFYSGWVSSQLKKHGINAYFEYPIHLQGGSNIIIGNNFHAGKRFRLNAFNSFEGKKFNPEIIIGNNVNINDDCHIGCINKVIIGDNTLIAGKVFISDHLHGTTKLESLQIPPSSRPLESKGIVQIEENVWIGEGVSILSGVTIGKGSVIGANSVVTKNIPPYSIAIGTPATILDKKNNDK